MSWVCSASAARLAASVAVSCAFLVRPVRAEGPAALSLQGFVAEVVRHSPALEAAKADTRVARADAAAVSALPEPELMLEIWEIPIEQPAALDRAGMVEIGLKQRFPAPGSLSRRRRAREHGAERLGELGRITGRAVARDAAHLFIDYAVAVELERLHAEHHAVIAELESVAVARFSAGESPLDAVSVHIESARIEAAIAEARASIDASRARMNALLGKAPDAPLGSPRLGPASTVASSPEALVRLAHASRPELRAAASKVAEERAELDAREREALVPSFELAALYFPPLGMQEEHGYGVSAGMSLPWLWGGRRSEAYAQDLRRDAALAERRSAALGVADQSLAALGAVLARSRRYDTLTRSVRVALERQVTIAESRLGTGRELLPVAVDGRRALLDLDAEIAEARGALEHALVDLDWAAGAPVPRVPLLPARTEKAGPGGKP